MQSMHVAPTADPRIARLLTDAGRPIALVGPRPSAAHPRVDASDVRAALAAMLQQLVTVHGIDLTAVLPSTDELALVLHDGRSLHRRGPRTTEDIGIDLRSHVPLVAWLTAADHGDARSKTRIRGLEAFLVAHRPALTFIDPLSSSAKAAGVLEPVRDAARALRENLQLDMYIGDGYGRTTNPLSLHQASRLIERAHATVTPSTAERASA